MAKRTVSRRVFAGAGVGLVVATASAKLQLGAAQDATPEASPEASPMASPVTAGSQIRILHASPDAPAVDIYVNGALAIENLAYGAFTAFTPVPAGDNQVQVTATGTDVSEAVIDTTVTLEAGFAYTALAIGMVDDIGAVVVTSELAPLADDKSRVRLVHASPDAPAVDVSVVDGPVLFENVAYPTASDYIEVDAGTYDLAVSPIGSDEVVLTITGVVLEGGIVNDLVAIGTVDAGTLAVVQLTAEPNR